MAARKRAKKQTLSEFRAWLAGVEELQPEAWAPDATQWQLIRDKIDNITEPKAGADTEALHKIIERMGVDSQARAATVNNNVNPYGGGGGHAPQPQQAPPFIPAPAPQGVPAGPVEVAPAASGFIMPPAKPVDLTAAAKPNIDSSDGNYNSSFT